ncbi:DinB family protein [Paeniglutamicibacter kerguelensis]|uniref:Damage-inducible protein DinB n=1 Tax=Paeniglutamicibacter kerguelensis TaxID=254788 RepID=A0ABS4X802_9MICC|nr:DinB family protein [Paeniglutamicibacter kerguelensis]MBP2384607.1 putative damage-inducible protein DinB [Paeniglutamicibacter kerguelensis]
MDDQKNHLLTYLNASREAVLWKAEGLDDYDLTRPLVPSGTNILGLIQHLASVELGYFVECLGQTVEQPRFIALNQSDDPEYDMWVPADIPSADILDYYRSAIASANRNIEALPLDAPATVAWWAPEKRDTTIGRLLIHMNVETARHAGHIDIVRELIDGSAGDRRISPNLPDYDARAWSDLHQKIQLAADSR